MSTMINNFENTDWDGARHTEALLQEAAKVLLLDLGKGYDSVGLIILAEDLFVCVLLHNSTGNL